MKRREFLKAAGVGAAAAAVAKPGDRAVDAGTQVAPDLELPEVARHIYGAAEIFAKAVAEATDNKFQIQVFAAGEIVPGLQAADAVHQRHRRDVPHRVLLLCRQGPDLRLRHRGAVRAQQPHAERLAVLSAAAWS